MFQKIHQVANRWCPKCWLSKKFPRRIPAQPSLQGLPLLVPCQPTAAKLPSQAPASTRTWSQSRLWPLPKYDCRDVLSLLMACLIQFPRKELLIKQMCIIEITPVHWPACMVACSKRVFKHSHVLFSRAPSGNPVVERSQSLAFTCQAEIQSSPAPSLQPNPAPQSVHHSTILQKRWEEGWSNPNKKQAVLWRSCFAITTDVSLLPCFEISWTDSLELLHWCLR